jgi:ADP-heptose:LPS heptosyltransferase
MRDHRDWMQLVSIPNLTVLEYDEAAHEHIDFHVGDTENDYREKLQASFDSKDWYASKFGLPPAAPPINLSLKREAPFRKPLVVLAPFATRINRTWEIHNWRILAASLSAAGYEVIALDAPHQPERCKEVGIEYFWGQPPAWIANVLLHADLLVSCDSGLAHIGGLLSTPTLVILSQQNPTTHFSLTANEFERPHQRCTECRFQAERGYEEKCDYGCWALQSISPRTVADHAFAMLNRGTNIELTSPARTPRRSA